MNTFAVVLTETRRVRVVVDAVNAASAVKRALLREQHQSGDANAEYPWVVTEERLVNQRLDGVEYTS